jgi:NCS1 family nucleobase:cation symporter-1
MMYTQHSPATFGIVSFFGILVASSSQALFSEAIWDPLELLGRILDTDPYDSGNRALAFFISAGFVVAQLGTNIAYARFPCHL